MKFLPLLSLFLFASCGEIPKTEFELGETRQVVPQALSSLESERITFICSALANKKVQLSQGSTEDFTFAVREKTCEQEELGPAADVVVSLEPTDSSYRLRRVDNGSSFIFPDLETNQTGVMKDICADLQTATSPKLLNEDMAIWFTTINVSTDDCNPGNNERCLLIETALRENGAFRVISKEWMKFQIDPNEEKFGFYTERRKISTGLCAINHNTEVLVNLK